MDELAAAGIDSRMAHIGRRIVFKENQVAFLQIAGRGNLRPLADRGEPGSAVPACAYAAGAQAEVDEAGAVEPLAGLSSDQAYGLPSIALATEINPSGL